MSGLFQALDSHCGRQRSMLNLKTIKRLGVILALLLGMAVALSLPARTQSIDELHNAGVALYEAEDYEAATDKFIEALRINPRAIAPLEYLGGSLLRLERYDDAVEFLNRAIDINPYDADTLYDLAVAYDNLGELDAAAENYQKAVEEYQIRPESLSRLAPEELYNNLGIAQLAQADFTEALDSFQSSTELDPEFGQGYYLQGITFTRTEDYPEAESSFDQSVSPTVEFDFRERGYNGKGVAQYLDGKLDESIASLTESITEAESQERSYPVAFANRGLSHFDNGELEDSENDYLAVTTLTPEDPEAFKDIGYVQYEIAGLAQRVAKSSHPTEMIATLPVKVGSYLQAKVTEYQDHLIANDRLRQPNALVAALPFVSDFMPLFPSSRPQVERDSEAMMRLALSQLTLDKLEASATSYSEAIGLDANFADAYYGLATVRRSQKKFQSALDEFLQAKTLYQNNDNQLWASFIAELDAPALEARLELPVRLELDIPAVDATATPEVAQPEDRESTPAAETDPVETEDPVPAVADRIVRDGFTFTYTPIVELFDTDQLDVMVKDYAIVDTVSAEVRREAVHALRLKQYRPAYPMLQNRLGKDGGSYREADQAVRSSIAYFLEEVEAPPPPAPVAAVPIAVAPAPVRRAVRPAANPAPVTRAPSQPAVVRQPQPVAVPATQQQAPTTFAPPVKPSVATGCGSDSVVSAAICRIRA